MDMNYPKYPNYSLTRAALDAYYAHRKDKHQLGYTQTLSDLDFDVRETFASECSKKPRNECLRMSVSAVHEYIDREYRKSQGLTY